MKNCVILLILLLTPVFLFGQKSVCSIGNTDFSCPSEYFNEIKIDDPEVRIFKYRESDDMFFFMSVPSRPSNIEHIGKLVMNRGLKLVEPIAWKKERRPLTMNIDTKLKYDVTALLGLSDSKLLEVKSFIFTVNGRHVELGYVSDLSEDRSANRRRFGDGAGFSDHAAGCNAVVTALNSLTKEFKGAQQYCSLSTFRAP